NTKKIKRETDKIIRRIQRVERRYRIYPPSKKLFFQLTEPAQLWFEGAEFHKLIKNSRIDEGTIVRYFRMALQVLRQLRKASQINQNLRNNISYCIGKTRRDVIDAENQLRQENINP
ncbi:MAG: hypothetical protein K9M01_03485, partial [Candidatus Omnitrophica bacterium]|nr:hypothetical protein [Candidatus Omnitrophota bacterium]